MISFFQTPTPNNLKSQEFYSNLGFKKVSTDPLIFTDGKAFIEINPDSFARAGLKLFKVNWQTEINILQEKTAVTTIPDGHLLSDPNGVRIYLMEKTAPIDPIAEEKCFGILGDFAGLSLETTDIHRSMEFYQTLGFSISGGSLEKGYLSLGNNGFTISLMKTLSCPHLFFNPSLTYFNGAENLKIIEKIRKLNIPITEEITCFNKNGTVDNIIIQDPAGLGFFIFND